MLSPCPSPVTKATVLTLTLRCFSTFYMLFIQFFTSFLQFKTQGHQSESLGTVQSLLWRQVPSTAVAPECPALPTEAPAGCQKERRGEEEVAAGKHSLPFSVSQRAPRAGTEEQKPGWSGQCRSLSHRGDGSCSTVWRMSHHRAVSLDNA